MKPSESIPTRDEAGRLPEFAWPGGYPIVYYCEDGGELCGGCANGENGSIAYTGEPADSIPDKQWHIVAADCHMEGAPIQCAHCGKEIESAYGEPGE